MLVIRDHQMEGMRAGRRADFYAGLLAEGRRLHPRAFTAASDASLLASIHATAGRAEAYGLFLREHVARFVLLVLGHGLDLEARDSAAAVLAVLDDPDLIGPEKLDRLEAILSAPAPD